MIIQDIIIMASCFGFAGALIPSIKGKSKPARSSCILTIILLAMVAVCFATLGLWLSVMAEITSITAWGILLFQRRENENKRWIRQ